MPDETSFPLPDHTGRTTSVWMRTLPMPQPVRLDENTRADVCIVGAGIAGLSTAYWLARAGKSVVVLDHGAIGGGETERTTAHLSNAVDDRFQVLERLHGAAGARIAAESHTAAIDRIERIVTEEGIDCDFARLAGYLMSVPGESGEVLQRELEAAHRAGLHGVEWVPRAPLPAFDTGPCLRFPRQAQFHPLKYLRALADIVVRQGGRIYTQAHVEEIEDGAHVRVRTRSGAEVSADAVVVATNVPISSRMGVPLKQAAYRTYVIGARVPAGAVPPGLYWDTADPYHYVRLQPLAGEGAAAAGAAEELLIVGGEDHKTGQADDAERRWARLEAWTRQRVPSLREVEYRWSGQIIEPADGVAYIGRQAGAERVYFATGDSGQGMTHGTIAGMLLTDLILGRPNSWAGFYDPARIPLRAAGELTRENLNVATRYAQYVTPGEVTSPDQIAPGTGAVIRRGLKKVAVYCDEAGTRHEFSAVCTHLGCLVSWNHAEQSWDCPCHGSRFDRYGRVLNGPAVQDLAPAGPERKARRSEAVTTK